jgi:hypothetical protein
MNAAQRLSPKERAAVAWLLTAAAAAAASALKSQDGAPQVAGRRAACWQPHGGWSATYWKTAASSSLALLAALFAVGLVAETRHLDTQSTRHRPVGAFACGGHAEYRRR